MTQSTLNHERASWLLALKLIVPSLLGLFIFFTPITLGGTRTIPLDHIVNALRSLLGSGAAWYALAMIVAGAVYPLVTGQWRRNKTESVFTVLKILGVAAALMAVTGWGPALLHEPDMLPFLFNKLVISVGLIVPVGAVFLSLLIGYGLIQLVGVLFQPLMRPL
ncbi:MAG: YjiH family protein, partial [Saccharospirillum sp.]